MDVFKQRMKLLLKIIVCLPIVYGLVIDPIVNDWEDTILYTLQGSPEVESSEESSPQVGSSTEKSCGNSLSCKFARFIGELAEEVREKKEIMVESRTNPDNQYNTIEECLNDDIEIGETSKTRDEWCDSPYVSIAESE
jgi:hypothetical protein